MFWYCHIGWIRADASEINHPGNSNLLQFSKTIVYIAYGLDNQRMCPLNSIWMYRITFTESLSFRVERGCDDCQRCNFRRISSAPMFFNDTAHPAFRPDYLVVTDLLGWSAC